VHFFLFFCFLSNQTEHKELERVAYNLKVEVVRMKLRSESAYLILHHGQYFRERKSGVVVGETKTGFASLKFFFFLFILIVGL
jgi:hypothetical protein